MQQKLAACGRWEPFDALYLELASMRVIAYVRAVSSGVPPAEAENLRQAARHSMASMLWIDPAQEHLALLDANGRDRQLMLLASPFTDHLLTKENPT